MPERDLFANFDRMRREMDELFGDVFERAGIGRGRPALWPAVDVAYASDPPRVIVTAELAGVQAGEIALHTEGRTLVLAGRRGPAESDGEVFQQVEIERGPFRRSIDLGADVRAGDATARYQDGMLRVELPVVTPPARSPAARVQAGDPSRTKDREPR